MLIILLFFDCDKSQIYPITWGVKSENISGSWILLFTIWSGRMEYALFVVRECPIYSFIHFKTPIIWFDSKNTYLPRKKNTYFMLMVLSSREIWIKDLCNFIEWIELTIYKSDEVYIH